MSWNYDASILSMVIVVILLLDVYANSMRSYVLTNPIFRWLAWLSLLGGLADFLVSVSSRFAGIASGWLVSACHVFYFLCFPLLGLFWFYYCVSITVARTKLSRGLLFSALFVYSVYAVAVLASPWNGFVFTVGASGLYRRGAGYVMFIALGYLCVLATIVVIARNFKSMDRKKLLMVSIYPVVASLSLLLQMVFPHHAWLSSGYCLLLVYMCLNVRNYRLLHDSITGVANRSAFMTKLDQKLKKGADGTVCLFSLDNFKFFNQKFGQENGDLLLKQIALYLSEITPSHCVYRYGGDQFVCIMSGGRRSSRCDDFIRTVQCRFSSPWRIEPTVHDGHAGIGADISALGSIVSALSCCAVTVEFSQQAKSVSEVTSALDFALFEAKSRGKSQVLAYDYSLVGKRRRRNDILVALGKAMADDSFELYYQPIIETASGYMLSAEVLLRLNDPVLGWISPSELIPIAEENGLIVDLTYRIISRVCRMWKALGGMTGHLDRITVNLSSVHFLQGDIGNRILETIAQNDGDPHHIKFEVTENAAINSYSTIRNVMEQLTQKGISFALDNFGKGYSSLNYLLELPFSVVKLDRSIIWQGDRHADLLDSVVHLLRRLNKKVIAEGVENANQFDMVNKLGIEHVQGFFYCSPVSEAEFIELVHEDTGADYRFAPYRQRGDDKVDATV